jgi:hypothetical protein
MHDVLENFTQEENTMSLDRSWGIILKLSFENYLGECRTFITLDTKGLIRVVDLSVLYLETSDFKSSFGE